MRGDVVSAVISREIAEIRRNRVLLFTIIGLPALFVLLPLGLGFGVQLKPLQPELIARILAQRPDWKDMDTLAITAAYGLQTFLPLYMIMPAMIPMTIATYSIIGEKQARTLEPVLATPIRTIELLMGKAVASLVPGIVGTWITYGLFLALATALFGVRLGQVLVDSSWLAGIFLLGPAMGLLSVVLGIAVSSRVGDPRTAQQVGGFLVLPVVVLILLQATGALFVGAVGYALLALLVAVIGLAGLRVGVALFSRETILTRWR